MPPSPVSRAFPAIQWETTLKTDLSKTEQSLLKSAEENPMEYTLNDPEDAAAYCRLLLKILEDTTGPSTSMITLSQFALEDPPLPETEALQLLYQDKMGVVTHYIVSKLYEVLWVLKDSKPMAPIRITTMFYKDGILLDDWRPLLRLLYMGGSGDAFAQRKSEVSCLRQAANGCG